MLLDCMCHFCCCLLHVLPDCTAYMYYLHVLPAQCLLVLPAYSAYLCCPYCLTVLHTCTVCMYCLHNVYLNCLHILPTCTACMPVV